MVNWVHCEFSGITVACGLLQGQVSALAVSYMWSCSLTWVHQEPPELGTQTSCSVAHLFHFNILSVSLLAWLVLLYFSFLNQSFPSSLLLLTRPQEPKRDRLCCSSLSLTSHSLNLADHLTFWGLEGSVTRGPPCFFYTWPRFNAHIKALLAHPMSLSLHFRVVCPCPQREERKKDKKPALAPRTEECRLASHLQPRGGLTWWWIQETPQTALQQVS